MLAQFALPSFRKKRRKKQARHKPNNHAPTPPQPPAPIYRFNFAEFRPTTRPAPRYRVDIADHFPGINATLSSPVIMVMSALHVSARTFVETVRKRPQTAIAKRPITLRIQRGCSMHFCNARRSLSTWKIATRKSPSFPLLPLPDTGGENVARRRSFNWAISFHSKRVLRKTSSMMMMMTTMVE